VANSSGSATITVTVSDGQALNSTVTRTFVVTVNNPPTLNAINNISLVQNAPVQTVNFSGVTSGAANEAQPLIVTAISSNPGVIPTPTTVYTSPSSTGYLLLQPLAGAVGSSVITVSVSDGQPGNNFTSGTFTVTVNAPAPNVPPTLNPISNVLLAQNAGTIFVSLGGISSGSPTEVQPLTVTATSSNPALIPNPTVSYSSPSSSGTLAFTPAANSSGTATITVTVNDGQSANNLISRSFVVTINSPPTLNPIPSMSVAVGSAWNVISLYGISAGGVGEVQPITVTASSSNTGLIPNPAIYYSSPNPNGALSFATVAGVSGTATITVTVKDGQTGNGVTTRAFVVTVGSTSGALSALSVPNGDGSAPDESTADTASGQDAAAGADVAGAEAVSPTAESAAAVPVPTADPADITSTTVSASSDAAADVPVSSVASTEPKPLEISNIVVSSSDARTLDITWQTDRPATCLMAYGATAALRWGGASSSGTEHTIHLANLEPATLYYLRVLGADAAGNFAVSDLSSAQTPGVNVLSWPAQSATLSEPMALGQDLDGTGDSFISAPDAGQGTASFNMQIPDGMVYRIWCRVLAPSGGSVGISLDGTAEAFASVPAAAGDWHWVLLESGSGPFTFLANGGFHQLTFRTFAPDVWVERVCISNDPEWRPLGFDSPVLSVSSLAGKVALLEWTDRWSNAEGYVVEASTGGGEYQTLTTVESSVRSLRVAITDASTSYRIYAFAAGDRGPSSAPVTLAQSSDQAPNAPQNLTGTITDDGTVSLNWQNGSAPQTGIVIERSIDQINFSTVQTLPGDATAVTDTPPGPGKYFYRAKGVNAATQSDPTDVITVIF
jgi:hypothetical protein